MKLKLLILLFLTVTSNALAQNISFYVTDEENRNLSYATIAIFAKQDSTLIQGQVTDERGIAKFSIDCSNLSKYYAIVSTIGYKKTKIENLTEGINRVVLQESSIALGEVEIKAQRPIARMENQALLIPIRGTSVSKIGTAIDLLGQLPLLRVDGNNVVVLGKGSPLIFIDGRQLRDISELQTLESSKIASVKIYTHPGVEFDSSVSSVIKIKTIKSDFDSLGGSVFGSISASPRISSQQYLYLQYQKGKLELFGSAFNKYQAFNQNITSNITFPKTMGVGVSESTLLKIRRDELISTLGGNYSINPQHQIGIRYVLGVSPYNKPTTEDYINVSDKNNKIRNEHYFQMNEQKEMSHHINLYYLGEITSDYTLRFDADFLKKNSSDQNNVNKNNSPDFVSKYNNNSDFYSFRIKNVFNILKGQLVLGGEASRTINNQSFMASSYLNDTKDKLYNIGVAGFLSYSYGYKNFSTEVGLRYEYNRFTYDNDGKRIEEQSKVYNDIFPQIALSYSGPINVNVSYQSRVQRPYYNQLRSNIQYDNAYIYEGGNPYLKPSFTHEVSLDLLKNNFMMGGQFSYTKNHVLFDMTLYQNKPIVFFQHKNIDQLKLLSFYAQYRHSFGLWTPDLYVGWSKPFLELSGKEYNKPTWQITFKNTFHLAKNTYLWATYSYQSSGNNSELMLFEKSHQMDLQFSHQFMNGKWQLGLKVSDVFNTSKMSYIYDKDRVGIAYRNKGDTRAIFLSIQYKFNSSKTRYQEIGKPEEMNRL